MKNHRHIRTILSAALLIVLSTGLTVRAQATTTATAVPEEAKDKGWPRQYETRDHSLVVYQPQVDEWPNFDRIRFRTALVVTSKQSQEPTYGIIEVSAKTDVAFEERLVLLTDRKVESIHFPGASAEDSARLSQAVMEAMPPEKPQTVSLDRLIANVDLSKTNVRKVEVALAPPAIFSSDKPAIMIIFLGKPRFKAVSENCNLMFAVNTNWDLFFDPGQSKYYLLNEGTWLVAPDAEKGPWTPTMAPSPELSKLPGDDNWADVRAALPAKPANEIPTVFVSREPAELVMTKGAPEMEPIPGTRLMLVTNTESDLLYHGVEKQFYLLAAGRWFKAADLSGPWTASSTALPEDFKQIPEESDAGSVLASVPGTPQANEAVIMASIPNKATVNKSDVTVNVTYTGAPEFRPIESTAVQYAYNTPFNVFRVDDLYYCCNNAVWFVAPTPTGTWTICSSVPAEIYTIPPTSPKYNVTVRLRLKSHVPTGRNRSSPAAQPRFGKEFDEILAARLNEADEFYRSVTPPSVSADAASVMRHAIGGMMWSKQFYFFDGDDWLDEHHSNPLHAGYRNSRNSEWFHMLNQDVISMPDKWEYPWYAAWDLAFHTLPIAIVDPDFAKDQIRLMLNGGYLHPSGQLPAYEWNFSDVNPPVHAWATLFLHRMEKALHGETDTEFLKAAFNKLLLNFTWWVNRKDRFGKNVFEGGFLGLDNIGIFDRSSPLPTGGHLEQADGTAWMALFSQNMLELAFEIALHDPTYEDMVTKFAEHFFFIASAMNASGPGSMWDEEDGFYYDLLRLPDGSAQRLKVRSMVGLLPLCATTVVEKWQRERVPNAMAQLTQRMRRMPELLTTIHPTGPGHLGVAERGLFALLDPDRLRRILTKMLDVNEFLSPYGIRSLSKFHEAHPYILHVGGTEYRVDYLPAESNTGMFGGNSNWRGPVWMPVNAMIIRALLNFYLYYGDNFKVECPTGSGRMMNLSEVSQEISNRLTRIFLRDEQGRRPVNGGTEKFQSDPHWRDHLLFYEYFHGDNGAGLGASHQTGWTGVVARLIQLFGRLDPESALDLGTQAAFIHGGSSR